MHGPGAVGFGKENRTWTPNFQIQRYLWLVQAPSYLLQALYIRHTPLFPVIIEFFYEEDRGIKKYFPTFGIRLLMIVKCMYIRPISYVSRK
jgi:hypothetical protein